MNEDSGQNERKNAPSRGEIKRESRLVSVPRDPHKKRPAFADAKRCSATSKRTRKPCGAPAMANGKCYHHGGATPKGQIMARPGNKNALKHGCFAPKLESETERKVYLAFIDKLYDTFADLNESSDLVHAQVGAMAFVMYLRAFQKDAAGSTLDDLSRILKRHLGALAANRDQRAKEGPVSGPSTPAEFAVEIIQQVKMYGRPKKGHKVSDALLNQLASGGGFLAADKLKGEVAAEIEGENG